ncbi:hypothetical protein JZ751_024339 [Albula glossodonta]|uniref:UPF3 domain-containing protein n=1 Tax=Albula glossodonta TaxID=121402 RepID=A0A8T2NFA6_9TELE|nr:hypothetical protein JZ751_024339 [Albula glossodonta]
MKENQGNTRPREKRGEVKYEENEITERPNKEKKEAEMTKIVIRRLPPTLTKTELEEQLQPLPEVDYLEFFSSDSRAYINFKNQEDIVLFRDRFDGYVFIDNRGQEYPAIVEFAPFQKIAKKKSKKKDARAGTIDEDGDYKKFLENYNGDDEKLTSTAETLLEEIEAKTKQLIAKKTTPLLDFLKNKQRIRDEKKEERRRREIERKRLRDEERRKWREEDRRKRKEAERLKKGERIHDKNQDKSKKEPKIKILRKAEKMDDPADCEKPKDTVKKSEKDKLKEDRPLGAVDLKKKLNSGNWDDRGRKCRTEEEVREECRDRDVGGERDRRQREKDRIKKQHEDRRRKRDRNNGENYRRQDEDVKKDKDHAQERKKGSNTLILVEHEDKPERTAREDKKEEDTKRDRLRNKDRPAIQLYQPGARSRNRGATGRDAKVGERNLESETKCAPEKGEE